MFEASDKILKDLDFFPDLEKAFIFLREVIIQYHLWLAYKKETGFPMNFHQERKGKKKIWIIKFQPKQDTTCAQTVEEKKQ